MGSAKERTVTKILFGCGLAVTVTIALLYLYNIIRWGEQLDAGFYRPSATGKEIIGIVTEVGQQAGIHLGDRILKVNEKALKDSKEFQAARNWKPGEKNTYLF
jgi:hypothetical protein